jgi:hypothetical protein
METILLSEVMGDWPKEAQKQWTTGISELDGRHYACCNDQFTIFFDAGQPAGMEKRLLEYYGGWYIDDFGYDYEFAMRAAVASQGDPNFWKEAKERTLSIVFCHECGGPINGADRQYKMHLSRSELAEVIGKRHLKLCNDCFDKEPEPWVNKHKMLRHMWFAKRDPLAMADMTPMEAPVKTKQRRQSVDYYDYIASPQWEERAKDMKRRYTTCQASDPTGKAHGCKGPLHVHHNTYDRLGREFDSDLVVLCEYHHGLIHGHNTSGPDLPQADGKIWLLQDGKFAILDNYAVVLVAREG